MYGQTGSGKTHTLLGDESGVSSKKGVIANYITSLFHLLEGQSKKYEILVSFFEIYVECIKDLLKSPETEEDAKKNLLKSPKEEQKIPRMESFLGTRKSSRRAGLEIIDISPIDTDIKDLTYEKLEKPSDINTTIKKFVLNFFIFILYLV